MFDFHFAGSNITNYTIAYSRLTHRQLRSDYNTHIKVSECLKNKDCKLSGKPVGKRLRWSKGSVLTFGTQVRGFKPGRSRRIFPKTPTWPWILGNWCRERDVEWRDRRDSQEFCRYRHRWYILQVSLGQRNRVPETPSYWYGQMVRPLCNAVPSMDGSH